MMPKAPQMIPVTEYLASPSVEVNNNNTSGGSTGSHSSSLLFYLSVLKDKVSHVQTLVGVLVSPHHQQNHLPESSTSLAMISTMNSTIQEIIVAATSIRFTCQQMMALGSTPGTTTCTDQELHQHHQIDHRDHRLPPQYQLNFANNNSNRGVVSNIGLDIRGQSFFSNNSEAETLDWFSDGYNNNNNNNNNNSNSFKDHDPSVASSEANINSREGLSSENETDIIEMDAADLLARYTHFCQVCGKGFKRDANLRMHMRAHGDEYKTNEALSNPMKKNKGMSLGEGSGYLNSMKPKKYSCPQEGCRWNKKHARFQPLKSMVCVKNHYKRSHCPKMYVCKRCNQKQFSVLSDLRTHEKHCGDPKWQCSCGTTFSRKDKLMGHVALFFGHSPVSIGLSHSGKSEEQTLQQQIGGSSRSCV